MKRFGNCLLIAWLLLGGMAQAASTLQGVVATTNLLFQVSAVDTFQRSNAGFTTPWVVTPGFPGNFEVSSDKAIVSSLTTDDNWNYSTVAPPGQQWAGVILGTPGTGADNSGYGVSVAVSNSAQSLYRVTCNQTGYEVYKIVAGAGSTISVGTGTTCAAGAFLSISLSNGTLTAYKNWVPFYTVSDSSLTSGQLGISYSDIDNGGAITQWQGGTYNTGGTGITPPSGLVFPQIGIQAIFGNQYFPTANLNALAQYSWILMGGNFNGWPAVNAANAGYGTRDQVVVGLKSQTHTGKNALTPFVVQYEDTRDVPNTSPFFPDWATAVSNNNWYVYASGSGGTKTPNPNGNSAWFLSNYGHVVGTDSSTGLYPGALAGLLTYNTFIAGTGSGGSAMASTHLNALYQDDFNIILKPGSGADWERNGTNPSATDPTAIGLQTTGQADFPTEVNSLAPSLKTVANAEVWFDMGSSMCGGNAIAVNNFAGKFDQLETQFSFGSSSGPSNFLTFAGFACFQQLYQLIDSQVKTGGQSILSGGVNTTDYQTLRYSLGATLMRNAIYAVGLADVMGSGGSSDLVDPGNSATFPQFDEFWCGVAATAGCLGTALGTSQGSIQTAAWLSGVWRRDFQYGIVLVNPAGNGSQTFSAAQLGGTFYYMDGTQDHTHNPGGSSPVTSVTLAAGDAIYLMRSPQP